jgi:hypothetical protein
MNKQKSIARKYQRAYKRRVVRLVKTSQIKPSRSYLKKFLLNPISIFMLLVIGVVLLTTSARTKADVLISVNINAAVPTEVISSPATITSPTNNQLVTNSPIEVSGGCQQDTYVELYRNGQFSGSAVCPVNLNYTIQTDLSPGVNDLVAHIYDINGLAGPVSTTVEVIYQPAPVSTSTVVSESPNTPSTTSTNNLSVTTSYVYRVATTTTAYSFPINLAGGRGPYVINITWGDGKTTTLFIKNASIFNIVHQFSSSGVYNINISVVDDVGQKAVLQLSTAVRQPNNPIIPAQSTKGINKPHGLFSNLFLYKSADKLYWIIWPTYFIVVLMAASFWLGERRELNLILEKYKIKKKKQRRFHARHGH